MFYFLKPTRQKVFGTAIVLVALLIGSYINETIATQLLPQDLFSTDLESTLAGLVEDNMEEFMGIGIKILVTNLLVNISLVYLSVCFILRKRGNA